MKLNISKYIKEIENDIHERCLDRYFADSWEQSNQISIDIDEMEKTLKTLSAYQNRGEYDRKIMLEILRRKIASKSRKYRIKESDILPYA